mgnify:CR=1
MSRDIQEINITLDIDKIKNYIPFDSVIKFYYTEEFRNKLRKWDDDPEDCGEEDGRFDNIEDVKHPEFMEWLVEQIEEGKDDYTYVALYKKEGDEEELIQVLWKNENY